MNHRRFAQATARVAQMSAKWSTESLDGIDDLTETVPAKYVQSYLQDMRERLDFIAAEMLMSGDSDV